MEVVWADLHLKVALVNRGNLILVLPLVVVLVLILILVNLPLVVALGNNPPSKEVSSVEYLVVNLIGTHKVVLASPE